MPLLLSKQINANSAYAVWNIQETFLELPYLSPEPYPAELHPVRQAEWIIGRVLIKRLCEQFNIEYKGIGSEATGKPFLLDKPANISISHSFPMACAMVHLHQPCGIDIEMPRAQMVKVQNKYLHPSEFAYRNDLEKLCIIWCAKEVMYKIYGRKRLSLKDELQVSFNGDSLLHGINIKEKSHVEHQIRYEQVKDYILGYNVA